MEGRLVQLDLSAAFDRVSHSGLLYKLRSIGVGGQFLSIVSQFLSDNKRVHLDGKTNVSDDVVSWVPQDSVLEPLLFILYTSELFHIVESHTLAYADETTTCAVIPT